MSINEKITVADLVDASKRDINMNLNSHAIAIVESFNAQEQTITAKIAYKKTYLEDGKRVLIDYPLLVDCPAVVLSGGAFSVKMPIKKGDECIILFNDRAIDTWFTSGQVTNLPSSRLHSLADGIALVGLRSLNRSLDGYSSDKMIVGDDSSKLTLGSEATLENGNAKVSVKNKIAIENSAEDLKSLLTDLITQVQAITVPYVDNGTPKVSGPPINLSAIAAIASRVGSLLE